MQKRAAFARQLRGTRRDGVGVCELDTRLRNRMILRPVRRSEANVSGLSEGPDPEAPAALNVLAMQVSVGATFQGQPGASTHNWRLVDASRLMTATLPMKADP